VVIDVMGSGGGWLHARHAIAADFYNLGVTLGLSASDEPHVVLEAGERGRLELALDPATFNWGGYRMSRFVPVAEFEVRGLANRYRQPGVGAPLAAELSPLGEGPEAEAARRRIPPRIKVPVTDFVRLDNAEAGIASGVVRGRIELYPADEFTAVDVAAVLGKGPISGLGDGVVMYTSAHLEGVGTELVVHSGHSTQAVPETIEEVRRILREHVAGP
jgi:hypothetical protein